MAFGLKPWKAGSNGYNTAGVTEYAIADGETDDMFAGCLMLQEASGYVTALALTPTGATALLSTVGVAVGFRYEDADGVPVWSQKYVGNASNTNAFALVVDDPDALFEVVSSGATAQADVGLNANIVSSTGTATDISQGNSTTGNSTIEFDHSSLGVGATLSVRLVAIPSDGENETSSTPRVVVKLNPDVHQLRNSTGL